jgi:hypothetical protein
MTQVKLLKNETIAQKIFDSHIGVVPGDLIYELSSGNYFVEYGFGKTAFFDRGGNFIPQVKETKADLDEAINILSTFFAENEFLAGDRWDAASYTPQLPAPAPATPAEENKPRLPARAVRLSASGINPAFLEGSR